jgi:hypothetical protein
MGLVMNISSSPNNLMISNTESSQNNLRSDEATKDLIALIRKPYRGLGSMYMDEFNGLIDKGARIAEVSFEDKKEFVSQLMQYMHNSLSYANGYGDGSKYGRDQDGEAIIIQVLRVLAGKQKKANSSFRAFFEYHEGISLTPHDAAKYYTKFIWRIFENEISDEERALYQEEKRLSQKNDPNQAAKYSTEFIRRIFENEVSQEEKTVCQEEKTVCQEEKRSSLKDMTSVMQKASKDLQGNEDSSPSVAEQPVKTFKLPDGRITTDFWQWHEALYNLDQSTRAKK